MQNPKNGTMSLDDLRVFVEVARAASFAGASEVLGLPRSTVSRRVAALEDRVGARLLNRSTRRVGLTPRGRRLYELAEPHLAALGHLEDDDADIQGSVRLTSTPDIAWSVLAPAVARFNQRFPNMGVEVVPSFRAVDLAREPMDFALRAYGGDLPDLHDLTASRLGTFRLGLYAAPRYLDRAGTPQTVEELADHRVLGPTLAGRVAVLRHARIASDDGTFLLAAVREGAGISVFPSFAVADDLLSGRLVPVLPSWAAWTGALWLLSPHGRDASSPIRTLRELITEAAGRKLAAGSEP